MPLAKAQAEVYRKAAAQARRIAPWISDLVARELILKRAAELDALADALEGLPAKPNSS